jgi:hypothetical protein
VAHDINANTIARGLLNLAQKRVASAFAKRSGAIFHLPKRQRAQRREQSAEPRPSETDAFEFRFVNVVGIERIAVRARIGVRPAAAKTGLSIQGEIRLADVGGEASRVRCCRART